MHFTINNADFQHGLRKIDPFISTRPKARKSTSLTLSVSESKAFPPGPPILRMSGEYADGYVRSYKTVASVTECGSVAVDAGMLAMVLRLLPQNAVVTVRKVQDKGKVVVEAGDFSLELDAKDPERIPIRYELAQSVPFNMPAADLAKLFQRTHVAMANRAASTYLNGVFLHAKHGRLRAAATDGHRLVLTSVPLPDKAGDVGGAIIPRTTVFGLLKALKRINGPVTVSISEGLVRIDAQKVAVLSRSVDGLFPEYERVIPGEDRNQNVVTVNTKNLVDLLNWVMPALDRKQPCVELGIYENSIVVSSIGLSPAESTGKIEASSNVLSMKIYFNAKNLLNALSVIEGDYARFKISDPYSPVIILDPKDEYTLQLIMPWA
jgi:DNA polymerase-3 subunit beta